MIGLIARKDFLLNLTSARFILGFLICLFIIPFTLIVSLDRYKNQYENYNINVKRSENDFNSVRVYSAARPEIVNKPQALSVFSEGINENLGSSVKIQFGEYPLFLTGKMGAIDNPLLNAFFSIDFSTVIAIIMSLLALVFSYDSFTRERENSTLRMILVNRVNRTSFFIGKLCGILLTLLPILLFCYLLSILVIVISPDIMFTSNEWLSVLFLFLSSVLYIIVFILLGMFISSMSRQSSTSIIVCLLAWIWFLFLMPNIASYSAQSFVKTELYDNVQFSLNEINQTYEQERKEKIKEIRENMNANRISYGNVSMGADGAIETSRNPKITYDYYSIYSPWQMETLIDYSDKKWAIQKSYYNGLIKQEKTQRLLALLSPSEIFIQLSSSVCHTDAYSYLLYMDNIRNYREAVIKHYKTNKFFESSRWFTAVDLNTVTEDINDEKLYSEPLDFKDLPEFRHSNQVSGDTLTYALGRIALLMLIALFLLMATMLRFRKYQV